MIPVYVISLARSEERRMLMRNQLTKLGVIFSFFDGVDGHKMTKEALSAAAPGGGTNYCGLMTPGEIGAALSHLAVIRTIAEGDQSFAAVVEDDVFIAPEVRNFLDKKFLSMLPSFHILQMASASKKPRLTLKVGDFNGYQLYASPSRRFSMAGLIYTREAARMISRSIKAITAPIDNMIFHDHAPLGLRVMEIRPSVIQNREEIISVIGARPRPMGLSSKANREFRRFRNQAKLWCSFMYMWGLGGIVRLRLTNEQRG